MSAELISRIKSRKNSSHGGGNHLLYSVSDMQGWRNEMEDAHCAYTANSMIKDWSFFAIFDGHGGDYCSRLAAKKLWTNICDQLHSKTSNLRQTIGPGRDNEIDALSDKEIIDAIKQGFIQLDKNLKKEIERDDKSGTTVVATLITKRHIFLINCGDSRGIFVRDNTLELATFDHKPTQLKEKQRIQNAGGLIALSRVNGGLATSRGIGDFEYKENEKLHPYHQFVSCEPDVYVIEREPEKDNFIVLACDGIWDVRSNEQVQDFIFKELQGLKEVKGSELEKITNDLVNLCFDSGSKDNMSVILIYFERKNQVQPVKIDKIDQSATSYNRSNSYEDSKKTSHNIQVVSKSHNPSVNRHFNDNQTRSGKGGDLSIQNNQSYYPNKP